MWRMQQNNIESHGVDTPLSMPSRVNPNTIISIEKGNGDKIQSMETNYQQNISQHQLDTASEYHQGQIPANIIPSESWRSNNRKITQDCQPENGSYWDNNSTQCRPSFEKVVIVEDGQANNKQIIADSTTQLALSKKKTTGPMHNIRYKAKMCKNWMKLGSCPYFEKCQFAHGAHEVEKWASRRARLNTDTRENDSMSTNEQVETKQEIEEETDRYGDTSEGNLKNIHNECAQTWPDFGLMINLDTANVDPANSDRFQTFYGQRDTLPTPANSSPCNPFMYPNNQQNQFTDRYQKDHDTSSDFFNELSKHFGDLGISTPGEFSDCSKRGDSGSLSCSFSSTSVQSPFSSEHQHYSPFGFGELGIPNIPRCAQQQRFKHFPDENKLGVGDPYSQHSSPEEINSRKPYQQCQQLPHRELNFEIHIQRGQSMEPQKVNITDSTPHPSISASNAFKTINRYGMNVSHTQEKQIHQDLSIEGPSSSISTILNDMNYSLQLPSFVPQSSPIPSQVLPQ